MADDTLLDAKCRAVWASLTARARASESVNIAAPWRDYRVFRRDMLTSLAEHAAVHGLNNTTLLRKDKSRSFSARNCRWATWAAQADHRESGGHRHGCRCGHVWRSKLAQPKACPRCKRYDLHKPLAS